MPYETCVVGDFNLPMLNFSTLNATSACAVLFCNMMLECSLTQFTKGTDQEPYYLRFCVTYMDAMLISGSYILVLLLVQETTILCLLLYIFLRLFQSHVHQITTYDFYNANIELLHTLLSSVSCPDLFASCSDIEDFYAVFRSMLF